MLTPHRKLHAEIDRLKAQIALLKAQNEQERRNVEMVICVGGGDGVVGDGVGVNYPRRAIA